MIREEWGNDKEGGKRCKTERSARRLHDHAAMLRDDLLHGGGSALQSIPLSRRHQSLHQPYRMNDAMFRAQ